MILVSGLQVIDYSFIPQIVSALDTPGEARGVALAGTAFALAATTRIAWRARGYTWSEWKPELESVRND